MFVTVFFSILLLCYCGDAARIRENEPTEDETDNPPSGFPSTAPAACGQNRPPQQQQMVPSWLPVNNIHVGGNTQTNCTALDELVTMVTRQTRLSERILNQLDSVPRKRRTCEDQPARSLPKDCSDILAAGETESGRYIVYPQDNSDPFYVYCDMETEGGGWTVIQRREDGSVGFYREWIDYKFGFGNINSEHWLGNEKIHRLSAQTYYILRVEVADFEGVGKYAQYDYFRLGDEETGYKLLIGTYDGDAGDSLGYHGNKQFVTKDRDTEDECALNSKGAWWYGTCFESNLNGVYVTRPRPAGIGNIIWSSWRGYSTSLKSTEMKIRPAN